MVSARVFGYEEYEVVEDRETAHPIALEYADEQEWKINHRRIHRYDRIYRIRRALHLMLGQADIQIPSEVLSGLRSFISDTQLMSRNIYEVVRKWMKVNKQGRLYGAIPLLIQRLGGPRWQVPYEQYKKIMEDAIQLHRTFEYLKRLDAIERQRFPKSHGSASRHATLQDPLGPHKHKKAAATHPPRRYGSPQPSSTMDEACAPDDGSMTPKTPVEEDEMEVEDQSTQTTFDGSQDSTNFQGEVSSSSSAKTHLHDASDVSGTAPHSQKVSVSDGSPVTGLFASGLDKQKNQDSKRSLPVPTAPFGSSNAKLFG
ncbi:hypothetical protein BC832DRAFT_617464 [Gaertneriomyces semiglobifer]|nr:hypothetical protein BC832DRAFT_617464 [Gaertneriomyces semiglobifer]